jgi:oligopeptide/dipeptide ABC transporter ATP-binding protein
MYRARVVEAGATDGIVTRPEHPYTRLLIASIPRVSSERNWAAAVEAGAAEPGGAGCAFMGRCPERSAACAVAPPPAFRTAAERTVACYRCQPGALAGDPAKGREALGTHSV